MYEGDDGDRLLDFWGRTNGPSRLERWAARDPDAPARLVGIVIAVVGYVLAWRATRDGWQWLDGRMVVTPILLVPWAMWWVRGWARSLAPLLAIWEAEQAHASLDEPAT